MIEHVPLLPGFLDVHLLKCGGERESKLEWKDSIQ